MRQNQSAPIIKQCRLAVSCLFLDNLAIDPQKGKLIVENIKLQTRQVMENIKAILEAAGYLLKDVVQSTVYLSSLSLFEEFNQEYAKHFEVDFPARATVGAELQSGALVEVSVVAYKD